MKLEWVNEWVEKGLLTKEGGEKVNAHVTDFMKEAASDTDAAMALGRKIAPWVVGVLGIGGLAIADKVKDYKDIEAIKANQNTIIDMFKQQKDKDMAAVRFEEIASISPATAVNKNLSTSIVKSRLYSGLSTDDHQRLALLEAHAKKNRSYKGGGFLSKVGSDDQGVADASSLGNTLADVYLMTKQAGTRGGLFNLMGKDEFKSAILGGLVLSGIPLVYSAIGGGVKAVNEYRDKKKMESDLETSFQEAVDRSDPDKEPLRANPDKARRAFQALAHFSPRSAAQPEAARAFMSKIVAYDQGINASDVKDLTEIERNIISVTPENAFISGFKNVAGGVGVTGLIQKGIGEQAGPLLSEMNTTSKYNFSEKRRREAASRPNG